MADSIQVSNKHQLIAKIHNQVVIVASVGIFVVMFCGFAAKDLLSTMGYQSRVISATNTAQTKISQDVIASNSLVNSYKAFVSTPNNIIGGLTNSSVPTGNNGDSAKIVLDALPSRYDFPALLTSLQDLITSQGVVLSGIGGTDEQLSQNQTATPNPQPVAMPFTFSATGSYQNIQQLVGAMESSIRPFDIQTEELTGDQSNLTFNVSAQTYYQPGKVFKITSEPIN